MPAKSTPPNRNNKPTKGPQLAKLPGGLFTSRKSPALKPMPKGPPPILGKRNALPFGKQLPFTPQRYKAGRLNKSPPFKPFRKPPEKIFFKPPTTRPFDRKPKAVLPGLAAPIDVSHDAAGVLSKRTSSQPLKYANPASRISLIQRPPRLAKVLSQSGSLDFIEDPPFKKGPPPHFPSRQALDNPFAAGPTKRRPSNRGEPFFGPLWGDTRRNQGGRLQCGGLNQGGGGLRWGGPKIPPETRPSYIPPNTRSRSPFRGGGKQLYSDVSSSDNPEPWNPSNRRSTTTRMKNSANKEPPRANQTQAKLMDSDPSLTGDGPDPTDGPIEQQHSQFNKGKPSARKNPPHSPPPVAHQPPRPPDFAFLEPKSSDRSLDGWCQTAEHQMQSPGRDGSPEAAPHKFVTRQVRSVSWKEP